MGTRSLTIFRESADDTKTEICVLYRQMDGYPTGHGADLKACLENAQIGNGIPGGLENTRFFNGFADLVPQTIARLKNQQTAYRRKMRAEFSQIMGTEHSLEHDGNMEPGGFYMYPPGSEDLWEEYVYIVYLKDNQVCVRVHGYPDDPLYDGPIDAFDPKAAEVLENEEDLEEAGE